MSEKKAGWLAVYTHIRQRRDYCVTPMATVEDTKDTIVPPSWLWSEPDLAWDAMTERVKNNPERADPRLIRVDLSEPGLQKGDTFEARVGLSRYGDGGSVDVWHPMAGGTVRLCADVFEHITDVPVGKLPETDTKTVALFDLTFTYVGEEK